MIYLVIIGKLFQPDQTTTVETDQPNQGAEKKDNSKLETVGELFGIIGKLFQPDQTRDTTSGDNRPEVRQLNKPQQQTRETSCDEKQQPSEIIGNVMGDDNKQEISSEYQVKQDELNLTPENYIEEGKSESSANGDDCHMESEKNSLGEDGVNSEPTGADVYGNIGEAIGKWLNTSKSESNTNVKSNKILGKLLGGAVDAMKNGDNVDQVMLKSYFDIMKDIILEGAEKIDEKKNQIK